MAKEALTSGRRSFFSVRFQKNRKSDVKIPGIMLFAGADGFQIAEVGAFAFQAKSFAVIAKVLQKGLNVLLKRSDSAGMARNGHIDLPDLEILVDGKLNGAIGACVDFRIVRIPVHLFVEGQDIASPCCGDVGRGHRKRVKMNANPGIARGIFPLFADRYNGGKRERVFVDGKLGAGLKCGRLGRRIDSSRNERENNDRGNDAKGTHSLHVR